MPAWVEHSIWWQVYPLGFAGAEPEALPNDARPQDRLPRVTEWLDYLIELGASGLALGPIFTSESHGYDTVDYFSVDPRLGTIEEFDALVAAAHERGIRVLLDGVFNHVGRGFEGFQRALAEGPGSPAAEWFHIDFPEGWPDSGGTPAYRNFEGHDQLVALNHESPAVREFVGEVMKFWLARGADGWRLDAAYAVPVDFWAAVLPRVREQFPEAYFVGEVIHGDYPVYVTEGTLDSVTQYELWKAIWSSINDGNLHELAWSLTRHNEFLDTFVPLTFVGNHDVTRIASKLDDDRHLAHALAILMAVGGTPSFYYGDEQAFTGVKEERFGGDDAIRPEFPDEPEDLAPYGWPVFELHKELIGVRRRNPWLHAARTETAHVENNRAVLVSRFDGHEIQLALSLEDEHVSLPVPGTTHVLAGAANLRDAGPGAWVDLGPHGWAILGTPTSD